MTTKIDAMVIFENPHLTSSQDKIVLLYLLLYKGGKWSGGGQGDLHFDEMAGHTRLSMQVLKVKMKELRARGYIHTDGTGSRLDLAGGLQHDRRARYGVDA